MIQKITTIPNTPERGADYDLGNGLYARVVFRVLQNTGATMLVEMQAYQIDASGNFLAAPNGEPSRTPSTTTEIHLSGCTGVRPTMTLKAGWVAWTPPAGTTVDDQHLPEGCVLASGRPTIQGSLGDYSYDAVTGVCWTWHPGALEGPVQDKAEEMLSIINNSVLLTDLSL